MSWKTNLLGAALLCAMAGGAVARDLTVVSWGGAYQDAQRRSISSRSRRRPASAGERRVLGRRRRRAARQGRRAAPPPGTSSRSRARNWRSAARKACSRRSTSRRSAARPLHPPPPSMPAASAPSSTTSCSATTSDKLKDAPKGWADFFDTKKYPGKRALRQGPKTTLEIALMADGVAPKDVYKVLAHRRGRRARVQEARHHQGRPRLVEGRRAAAATARLGRSGDDRRSTTAASTPRTRTRRRTSRWYGTGSALHARQLGDPEGQPEQGRRRQFLLLRRASRRTRRTCRRTLPTAPRTRPPRR